MFKLDVFELLCYLIDDMGHCKCNCLVWGNVPISGVTQLMNTQTLFTAYACYINMKEYHEMEIVFVLKDMLIARGKLAHVQSQLHVLLCFTIVGQCIRPISNRMFYLNETMPDPNDIL